MNLQDNDKTVTCNTNKEVTGARDKHKVMLHRSRLPNSRSILVAQERRVEGGRERRVEGRRERRVEREKRRE